jgi:hypothetical protein
LLKLAYVPPRLDLTQAAWLLGNAQAAFGVDTVCRTSPHIMQPHFRLATFHDKVL